MRRPVIDSSNPSTRLRHWLELAAMVVILAEATACDQVHPAILLEVRTARPIENLTVHQLKSIWK